MTRHARTLTTTTAMLCVTAILAGCAGRPATSAPTASPSPNPASTSSLDSGPDQPGLVDGDLAAPQEQGADPTLTPGVPLAASAAAPPVPSAEQTQLRELFFADPPTGTGPQIALRFLQALQAGQDFTAAHELYIAGRTLLAQHDLAFLQQVMDDIRNNAGLRAAPRCSTATPVNAEAAAVRCGQLTVVVHVMADEYGSGVQISDAHPAGDSYRAPHSHAFTRLEL